jgi:hypothetical protein
MWRSAGCRNRNVCSKTFSATFDEASIRRPVTGCRAKQMAKTTVTGRVLAVQPRIRLLRSFDQRQHNYPGYALLIESDASFWVGVGPAAHAKYRFCAGGTFSAEVESIANPELETVDYYKAAKIQFEPGGPRTTAPPPWLGVPPELAIYRKRGHRRLAETTYESFCLSCIWGCRMPVEMTIDQWNPKEKQYRRETFCYGPKSCPKYQPGPIRKVPGRNNTVWEEEDGVDEEATSHRGQDD